MEKETLLFFIKATLKDEKHLGSNLKKQCIDYVDDLLKKNQELKNQLEKRTKMYQNAYNYSQKMGSNAIILETQQEEQRAFDKCMKAIRRLLIEEKQCKQKLERIQKDKMNCIRVLLDDKYCEEIIGDDK